MRRFASAPLVVCGLASLLLGGKAYGQLLRRHCPAPSYTVDCVQAPAPKVVVEMSPPQVVIQDTGQEATAVAACDERPFLHLLKRHKHRSLATRATLEVAPTVATVLSPVAAVNTSLVSGATANLGSDFAGLKAAQELEFRSAMMSATRAAQDAELRTSIAALERVKGSMAAQLATQTNGAAAAAAVNGDLADQVANIKVRVKNLEEKVTTLIANQLEISKRLPPPNK